MKLYRLGYSVTVPLLIFFATLTTVQADNGSQATKYCKNVKCRIAAAEILLSQNKSVNPCNDFYAHACGGRRENHFSYLTLKIHAEISELFRNIQPGETEALRKSKKFYDACIDWDSIEGRGVTPVERVLSDNGEWPILSDKWNNQYFGFQEIHENFAERIGISALFDITVEIDRGNSDVHILSLSVPKVPSGRAQFVSRTKREIRSDDYRRYLADVVQGFANLRGLNIKTDDLIADCQGIIEFEDKLDKLAILSDDDEDDNADDMRITTVETLQNEWDVEIPKISDYSINWLNTLNARFQGTGIEILPSDRIALRPREFVAKLAHALVSTPVRTIVNYIHWRVVDNLLPLTNTRISNPRVSQAFASGRSGICINDHKMTHAVAYMYAKKHLSIQSKTAALEIVKNIRDEVKREITESSWLDEQTKSLAREKVEAMTNFVGYPEWYDEPGKIDEYYIELTVGSDYFENALAYNKFEMKKKLSKLRTPVDKTETEWIAKPYIVNAEYEHQTNSLSLPAAILQSPFFVYERSTILNYGAFGAIAGHEISHGLDTKGRLYDKAGNKKKWWSQSTIDTYKTKAQCFVKQYDKYASTDINEKTVLVDGTATQRENIADTIGFRAGLRAYQRVRVDGKTNNVKIRLLSNFTDEQLYFYELAYTLCQSERSKAEATEGSDSHSPERLRIIGALSNMQEFADAFHCPSGSPMNPPEKCLIWD